MFIHSVKSSSRAKEGLYTRLSVHRPYRYGVVLYSRILNPIYRSPFPPVGRKNSIINPITLTMSSGGTYEQHYFKRPSPGTVGATGLIYVTYVTISLHRVCEIILIYMGVITDAIFVMISLTFCDISLHFCSDIQ